MIMRRRNSSCTGPVLFSGRGVNGWVNSIMNLTRHGGTAGGEGRGASVEAVSPIKIKVEGHGQQLGMLGVCVISYIQRKKLSIKILSKLVYTV